MATEKRIISQEELKQADGSEGKPVYVAYEGRVFDVSLSQKWKTGRHMGRHTAGRDLTAELAAAPHGTEVLERFSAIGELENTSSPPEPARKLPPAVSWLLHSFPILRRHPHPFIVHFPTVFMLACTFFNLLFLITGDKSYETTALHCLAGGVIFVPLAIISGLGTWWLNYEARFIRPVVIKMILSAALLLLGTADLIWRLAYPQITTDVQGAGLTYYLTIFMLSPLVLTIGWFGATLTFPPED